MKKIMVLILLGICANTGAKAYDIHTTYCATSGSSCLWCMAGGTTHSSDCVAAYAGCGGRDATNVAVGSSSGGLTCTSSGFCYSSCSSQWVPHPTIPHMQVLETCNGCKCTNCTTTDTMQCESGYEQVGEECLLKCEYGYERIGVECLKKCGNNLYRNENGECVRCPQVQRLNSTGEYVDFYGVKMGTTSSSITFCRLPQGSYMDDGGYYSISGGICFWDEE